MKELWRDIPGYQGYQASNLGRIRSLPRKVKCRHGYRGVPGAVLKPTVAKITGYPMCSIFGKQHSVHRLVGITWCSGMFPGAHIDHLNCDRTDNRAENLEWVTQAQNVRRTSERGRYVNPYVGKFAADHPTSKPVIAVCLATGIEIEFACAMDAVRQGFDSSCISRCCAGQQAFHKGHSWRFDTRHSGFARAA